MNEHNITFILIQINEAHSSLWPVALHNQPEPQTNITDRLTRANEFYIKDSVPFTTLVDVWSNEFEQTYHAWPDKYLMVDSNLTILEMSEYGTDEKHDAQILNDSLELVMRLIK